MASNLKKAAKARPSSFEIFEAVRVEFRATRHIKRQFHEVFVDPYTVSLSKHNRGLQIVFKRSGLNHRNLDHWKYLLSIVTAALFPPEPVAGNRNRERNKKWNVDLRRAFFLDVAKICVENGKTAANACADLKITAAGSSPYAGPGAKGLANRFSALCRAAEKHLSSYPNESWMGIGYDDLRDRMERIKAQRRGGRKQRSG